MKLRPLYILIILLLIVFAFIRSYPKFGSSAEKNAYVMGTPVRVKVTGANAGRLGDLGIEEIRRLDQLFSTFKPQSEISRLNAGEKIKLSLDASKILEQSARIKKSTDGAFDVKYSGKIDLGAIGKGYAVESSRQLLMKLGAKSAIIDMRSSIAVMGPKTWKIGIQHPRKKNKLLGVTELSDGQSLATSGDYERGLHIIDPRIHEPAETCWSVTIVGTNATETDALSTAVYVLGAKKGLALIESLPGIEGLIIVGEKKIVKSSGFILK